MAQKDLRGEEYRDSTEKGKILKKGKNIGTPLRLSKPNKYWVERSPKKGAYGVFVTNLDARIIYP
ncbi:hypothetical protein WN944_004422 [Citrus x changshan-huyou]|uniref:Uncharacterized protein n=1 Tax=Citrus x changshan-huyou TaxID=2935761 RepID=A0AAP0QHS6_9ROSI